MADVLPSVSTTDERLALDHAPHANRQRDRHYSRQRLRHHRDRQGDAEDEHLERWNPAPQSQHDDDRHDGQRGSAEERPEAVEVLLEWRATGLDRLHESADAAELGGHAGGHHHALSASAGDQRPGVGHVAAIAERQVWLVEGAGGLVHGRGLTGERGFVDRQVHRQRDACVGRDPISGAKDDQIPRHQIAGRHRDLHAPSDHVADGGRHLPQRFECPLCPVLLNEPEQHGKQHDHRDDGGLQTVAEQAREQRGREQDGDEDVLELCRERVPGGVPREHLQLVGTVNLQTAERLPGRQSRVGRRQRVQDVGGLACVPGRRLTLRVRLHDSPGRRSGEADPTRGRPWPAPGGAATTSHQRTNRRERGQIDTLPT